MVTLAGMIRQLASLRCSTNSVSPMDWTFSLLRFRQFGDAVVECPDCRLRSVLHVDLFQNRLEVYFDRAIGNLEVVRDLLVLRAFAQAAEGLHFAIGQAV